MADPGFDFAFPIGIADTTPTEPEAWVLIVTYAGFTGESVLLERLYPQGIAGERIDDDLEVFRSEGQFTFWSHTPRQPWQTQQYYAEQRRTLRPNAYARLHENQWVSGESAFITTACANRSVAVRCANGSVSGRCALGLSTRPPHFGALVRLAGRNEGSGTGKQTEHITGAALYRSVMNARHAKSPSALSLLGRRRSRRPYRRSGGQPSNTIGI